MKNKTPIEELFTDLEKFGYGAIKSKIDYYLALEKEEIVTAFDEGFVSQISDDCGQSYYSYLFGRERDGRAF